MAIRKISFRPDRFPSSIVLLLGLTATAFVTFIVFKLVQKENNERFVATVKQVEHTVKNRMERYQDALIQLRSHILTTDHVTVENYRKYVDNLMLIEKYPGIQGLGYTVRIPQEKLDSHTSNFQKQGYQNYQVWPKGERPDYFSIIYLEPLDWRNQRAIGFDMFTEPIRKQAMEKAWLTGLPALSGKVILVQETEREVQPGFLMYIPVYADGHTPSTEEGRKSALLGFVYSPFRAEDLFDAVFRHDYSVHQNVSVKIYDGNETSGGNLLYTNDSMFNGQLADTNDQFSALVPIQIAGRTWSLVATPRESFYLKTAQYAPFVIASSGVIFSLLLFWIVSSAKGYAKKEATSRETLELINKVGMNVSAELDLQTLVQSVTDAGTKLSKAQFGAFFYNVIDSNGESYTLYAISGVPREAFSKFPMPRKTKIFGPTFSGDAIVRSDDITKDPRYGKNAPYHGMPDGHLPVKSYLAVPVVSRSGEVLGGLFFGHSDVGIFTDESEKIIAAVASQAAIAIDNARLYQRAQEAIQTRDQFLSICSHELKTPITALKFQSQLTNRQIEKGDLSVLEPERIKKMCETIDRQLNQLVKLVDDMLDVSRVATGNLPLAFEKANLTSITQEIVNHFSANAKDQGIKITTHLNAPVFIECDIGRIQQVIRNLISNAMKYGNQKPIEVSSWIEGDRAKLAIKDYGIGIEAKDIERIFQRFERVISSQTVGGLGLGLFVSQQIAEAHQGNIHVISQPGEGTVFTLDLPIKASIDHFRNNGVQLN